MISLTLSLKKKERNRQKEKCLPACTLREAAARAALPITPEGAAASSISENIGASLPGRPSHQGFPFYSLPEAVVSPALSEPRLVVSVIFSEEKDGQFWLAPDYSCLRITQQYDAINPVFPALGRGQQQRRLPDRTLRDDPFG